RLPTKTGRRRGATVVGVLRRTPVARKPAVAGRESIQDLERHRTQRRLIADREVEGLKARHEARELPIRLLLADGLRERELPFSSCDHRRVAFEQERDIGGRNDRGGESTEPAASHR